MSTTSFRPKLENNCLFFELRKPIYNTTYAIWNKWLKKAKEHGLDIVIKAQGIERRFTFQEYMSCAERIERKFKFEKPMIFYKRDITL